MLPDILRHTPTWVWILLTALLALGAWQTRPRSVARGRLLALPLTMLGLGLWSTVTAFAALPLTALAWALALAGAFFAGRRLPAPAGARWDAAARRLHLPGSWLPLVIITTVFTLRYGSTVALILHPAWRHEPMLLLPLAALFGLLGGLFLGRAVGLLALTQPAHATIAADGHHARLS